MILHQIKSFFFPQFHIDRRVDADTSAPEFGKFILRMLKRKVHGLDACSGCFEFSGGIFYDRGDLRIDSKDIEVRGKSDLPVADRFFHELGKITLPVIETERVSGVIARHVIEHDRTIFDGPRDGAVKAIRMCRRPSVRTADTRDRSDRCLKTEAPAPGRRDADRSAAVRPL